MGEFPKPIPGEADALSKDSRYHGKLIETMSLVQSMGIAAKESGRLTSTGFPRYTIKNETAVDVPRGGVLGLDGFIFDADDSESNFLGSEPKFRGVAPLTTHGTRIAIAVAPIPAGEIRSDSVALFGPVPAKVGISDTAHRFCKVLDDDVTKLVSDASGPFPMLPAQSGVGTKWALVTLGGGSGSGSDILITIPGALLGKAKLDDVMEFTEGSLECVAMRWQVGDPEADPPTLSRWVPDRIVYVTGAGLRTYTIPTGKAVLGLAKEIGSGTLNCWFMDCETFDFDTEWDAEE